MTLTGFFDKFPDEIREIDFDASDILVNGDTIASIQALSLTTGLNIVSSSFAAAIIKVVVSGGGAVGQISYAVVKATLASGQLREASLSIVIKPLPGAS